MWQISKAAKTVDARREIMSDKIKHMLKNKIMKGDQCAEHQEVIRGDIDYLTSLCYTA